MSPCSGQKSNYGFLPHNGSPCSPFLTSETIFFNAASVLKMEAASCSKTLVPIYQITPCHIPEDIITMANFYLRGTRFKT
jgi:hypothetical protein